MKDIIEIRRDNLRALMRERHNDKTISLAQAIGRDQKLVAQWVSDTTYKPIANRTAREIEEALKLPRAWLDNIHNESTIPPILRDTIICAEQSLAQEKVKLPPERKADLILTLCEMFSPANPPTVAAVRRFLRWKL